jgi:hypothetical protein
MLRVFQTYVSFCRFLLSGFACFEWFAVDSVFPDLPVFVLFVLSVVNYFPEKQ